MSRRWALALLLLAAACGHRGKRAAQPDLQVVGESTKLRRGDPLPASSPFFDGKTVSLRAVRGETLGVQVLVRAPADVTLTIGGDGVAVQPFTVGYVRVREPSSRMYGPSRGSGDYPDRLDPTTAPVHAQPAAYFDVAVAAIAAPGDRTGTLTVGDRRFPVTLSIAPVAIDVSESPLVWVWYSAAEVARAHGMADDDSAAELAIERRYVDLFRAHGAYLMNDPSPERFAARKSLFDPAARYWPVWIHTDDHAAMARDVSRWVDIFRDLPQIPFVIPVDEPHGATARARVVANGRVIRDAGGGWPHLLHAVTDRWRPSYGDDVDVFISPRSVPPPRGVRRGDGRPLSFWTYNGRPPRAGSMVIDTDGVALRTWGWIGERYDLELWYAWEGLYFTDRYNGADAPTDLMATPITFDQRRKGGADWGNGDGLLAYPDAVPSLRLEALRRGLEDRLLLRKLAACGGGGEAAGMVRAMIPRALAEGRGAAAWPSDEAVWETARRTLIDRIALRCGHE